MQGEDGAHVQLEVAQTPSVPPPSCPHPGPRLDLRREMHSPQTQTARPAQRTSRERTGRLF